MRGMRTGVALAAVVAALAVGGCTTVDGGGYDDPYYAAPKPLAEAADPDDLLDRAAAMSAAIGDAPPDALVPDSGGRAWVWRLEDGSVVLADAGADGGTVRFAYAAPGPDGRPDLFLIRDDRQAFAYAGPEAIAMFDADDRLVSGGGWQPQADLWRRRAWVLLRRAAGGGAGVPPSSWLSSGFAFGFDGGWWERRHWEDNRWRRQPWFDRERERRRHGPDGGPRPGGYRPVPPGGVPGGDRSRWDGRRGGDGSPPGPPTLRRPDDVPNAAPDDRHGALPPDGPRRSDRRGPGGYRPAPDAPPRERSDDVSVVRPTPPPERAEPRFTPPPRVEERAPPPGPRAEAPRSSRVDSPPPVRENHPLRVEQPHEEARSD